MPSLDTSRWDKRPNRKVEDKLLLEYCRNAGSGTTFAEVPIGKGVYPRPRRVDAIRFASPARRSSLITYDRDRAAFEEQLSNARKERLPVEVIEVKCRVNRGMVGQVIVAEWLLNHPSITEREPNIRVKKVILCKKNHGPLANLLSKHGIVMWPPTDTDGD
jgi:hypothetical protein